MLALARRVAVVTMIVSSACSSETVSIPPQPPVDWHSFALRPPAPDAGSPSATTKERGTADSYARALSSAPSEGGARDAAARTGAGGESALLPSDAELSKLGPLLDEDAHFSFAGFKDVRGRNNVVKAHEALFGLFADRRFLLRRVLLADDSQVLEWTMIGTHRATRKPVVIIGLALLWIKDDGAIRDVHVYFDEARSDAQIGLGPKALTGLPPPELPTSECQELKRERSPEERANLALVRSALDALDANDERQYLAEMAEDVELTTLESERPARGKAKARAYFTAIHRSIAALDSRVDNGWGIGPFVAVEYHIVGEQRGPIGFVPPRGDAVLKLFFVDVVEIQNRKIARIWRYDNPSQILTSPEGELR